MGATKERLRSALGVSKFLFFFFSLFRRSRLRMGEKFVWMPIAFVFMQLIRLPLQEDGIADVRANYQEMRNQEKRSRRAAQGTPIPEGYEYDEESRRAFKLHNTKKNWQDAQKKCQMEGGNLVTADTPKINNILKPKKKLMWIGASDLETEGTFVWTNGKKLSYTSWGPNEPNGREKENCVEVNWGKPGLWNDKSCRVSRAFMCERVDYSVYEYNREIRRAFKVHNAEKNWQDAQRTCQEEGGNLVTVDTPEINNILKSKRELMWIGASDLNPEKTFVWTTGKSLKYTNWKPGQPSGDGDCVEVNFYKPGLWNDKPCHVSRKFMCERGFPEDYKYDEKSRRAFKLHNSKKNWQDAQQTCQMEGGNLVTVDTSEINNILKSEKKRIWIGASDLETEETFLWTNGKPLSYSSWAPGEPNNHGNREDCVEVNFRSPGLWNDAVCGALRPFMCEIDLPTIPTSLVSTKSPKITTASSTVSASSKTRSPTTTTRSSPTTKAPSKTTKTTTTTTKTTTKTKPPPSTTNTTPKKTQTTSQRRTVASTSKITASKTTTTSTHIQQTTSSVSSLSGGAISLASGGKALASTLWDKSKALRAFQGGQWHSKEGVSPAAPQWIQYEFNQPASVCRITFKPRHDMPISQWDCPTRYEFRGSADGNAFKTLLVVDDQTCQNDVEIHRN